MNALSRLAKKTAALLPRRYQQELKRLSYQRQIARETFRTPSPSGSSPRPGSRPETGRSTSARTSGTTPSASRTWWGPRGRAFAFEPVSATFALLAANVMRFPHANVTLLNLGASESTQERGMVVPFFDTGLPNHYGAQLSAESDGLRVLTCAIDSLALTRPVRVLKIEAEGHGAVVISGARALIARNHRRS